MRPFMRSRRRAVTALALATVMVVIAAPALSARDQHDLIELRHATSKYADVEVAMADGYQLGYRGVVTGCIAHETDGAMGYHYFNWDLFDDPAVDPLRPEGLVYAPRRDGSLTLVAVEWVVPKGIWEDAGFTDPPNVLGMDLHILNPVLNWYIQHAWVWYHNPSGVFSDWNPRVVCPS